MSDILDPLPEVVYCSRLGCIASIHSELLSSGWLLLAGVWFCPVHVDDFRRRLDDIDQEDSAVPCAVDPDQTQDMPAPEDDP